jgi:SagB-type dehydrogenase family enzyme
MKPTPSLTDLDTVLTYHERTKHHHGHYARSLGYMDWATQPDPFRRYEGADLLRLDEIPPTPEPSYDTVFWPRMTEARPVDRASVSQLFYDSLALSAWKEVETSRWSLRVNPSSGNLHPTEGYLLSGPIPGLSVTPGLYHYSPFEHGLEVRTPLSSRDWSELTRDLPPGGLLIGLTSILWRESWKYGERAFRYCHHDVGHAIASVALAASALGWRTQLLAGWTDRELAVLLGVSSQGGVEAEQADCLLVIYPATRSFPLGHRRISRPPRHLLERLSRIPMSGEPNQLSSEHHLWPVIDEVAAATSVEPPAECSQEPRPEKEPSAPTRRSQISARQIIRQRRSAVALDGKTSLHRDILFGMLERTRARPGRVPFDSLPWDPAIHLVIFAHRVDGLEPGLYCLIRNASALEDLKLAMRAEFDWSRPIGCPEELPFYRLARGDCSDMAQTVSCHQEIASDGAFALAMVSEFEPCLREYGAWFYKRLHWEAGAVGQVLYLEAEAASVRATGIGCFLDDALHKVVGLEGRRYQDLYHFTVGGAVNDPRLRTTPAYTHLVDRFAG